MWDKNNRLGFNADNIFKWRLAFLSVIGLIHALWFGNVLHKYAPLGYSLLYFNRKPVDTIVKWMSFESGIVNWIHL